EFPALLSESRKNIGSKSYREVTGKSWNSKGGERFMLDRNMVWMSRLALFSVTVVVMLLISEAGLAQQQVSPTISVTVNKSTVFRLAQRAKRVSVTQPAVAEVLVVAPNQLLINGKNIGTTSLIVFDEKGEVTNYDLVVGPDIDALRRQLRATFPAEQVNISTSGPSLVLRGEVSNESVYDRVLEIAITYLPPKPPAQVAPSTSTSVSFGTATREAIPTSGTGFAGGGAIAFNEELSVTDPNRWGDKKKIDGIVDLLVIKEIRQIELDVVVAEVALNKLRDIGFDISQTTRNVTTNSFIGSNRFGLFQNQTSTTGTPTINVPPVTGTFSYVTAGYTLATLYRLIQNKDVSQILAQPRLVVKNGRSGGFLAGGEFPVVVATANTFGVEFKPFGVRLDFIPTITWSDRIDLRVFPEVSNISSLTVLGVPGLEVRRTVSRLEMKEGESLIIGGLLDHRVTKDITKFPLLGDVPILGALFRSTKFSNNDSELVFVITPRIVRTMKPGEKPELPSIEKYDDPDIRQVPLPESWEKKSAAPGATIP
ncbi:MAG TPA: pilus assembly protein N-terminal domain-containing protein, partial [Nitrososphaera sp.]|nr:pilus assembly protein N-terminal domain-containing protein [Nitrososphaera sp.]